MRSAHINYHLVRRLVNFLFSDRLLALRRRLRPQVRWTVHGFRGKPALALQLLQTGMDLSFGGRYCAESYALTPPDRRHRETDDD